MNAKRHRKVYKNTELSKNDIRRVARRGGVKRISHGIYGTAQSVLREYLTRVLKDAIQYTDHANRKTVTPTDVVYALKRQGKHLYGYS